MGHARGVIYLAAGATGVPVESYTATRVKKSLTGNGTASKQQVQRMVCQLLGLSKALKPADVTDALALAICHATPGRSLTGDRRRRGDVAPAVAAALAREAKR
jgi:crossover junction endodeoxyribonuclease RuvC